MTKLPSELKLCKVQRSQSILVKSPSKKLKKQLETIHDANYAPPPTNKQRESSIGSRSPMSVNSRGVKKRYLGDRTFMKTQKVNSPLVSANLRFQEAFRGIKRLREEAMSNTHELDTLQLLEE